VLKCFLLLMSLKNITCCAIKFFLDLHQLQVLRCDKWFMCEIFCVLAAFVILNDICSPFVTE
jgi:hypothetical protein